MYYSLKTMFRNKKFVRQLIISISLIGLLLLIGLFFVNYDASYILFSSIFVGFLLKNVFYSSRQVKIISFILLILVMSFCGLTRFNKTANFPLTVSNLALCESYLDKYSLIVNYPNNNSKEIEAKEEVIPDKKTKTRFVSQKANIPIKSKGFVVNEVTIKPLDIIGSEPNFAKYNPPDCENRPRSYDVKNTNKAIVELKGFPAGSFYQADNANISTAPDPNLFTGHESVELAIRHLHEPITFTYFSFPYYYLGVFLRPLLVFAKIHPWIIVCSGTIIGAVFNPKFIPIINIAAGAINFMSQNSSRMINTTGGNYNESIGGNYIQGNRVNTNQNLSKAVPQIEQSIDRDNALTNPMTRNVVSSTNQPQTPVQNYLVCTNCSHNNLANLNFCTKCGTKLNQPHI